MCHHHDEAARLDADAGKTEHVDRREALRRLGLIATSVALGAAGLGQAQMQMGHAMGGDADAPLGPPAMAGGGRPGASHHIPWSDGRCAFCNMTLATPEDLPQGAGFRERTYAQWSFDGEARHFESIGCALDWAWVHGVDDGAGAALYVAPYDLGRVPGGADLLSAADASFLWAEMLPSSMRAKVGAFANHDAAVRFVATAGDQPLGRRRFADLGLLVDLAPLPINNLVPLLVRHAGL